MCPTDLNFYNITIGKHLVRGLGCIYILISIIFGQKILSDLSLVAYLCSKLVDNNMYLKNYSRHYMVSHVAKLSNS